MRQKQMKPLRHMSIGVAAVILALLVTLRPGAALAKDHPQITLNPTKGGVDTTVAITGQSFAAFCAGIIFIDNDATSTGYNCDNNGGFHAQLTWPDGYDDGKHTITARGVFSSASTTFTQSAATPTPDASATAAVGATATASAAQATASATQATATASTIQSTATAKAGGAANAGNTPTSTNGSGPSPALLGMILVASLLLIAGGVLLALALSNRRHGQQGALGNAYHPYHPAPPPPPPTDAALPQGDQWIWPNDPYRR